MNRFINRFMKMNMSLTMNMNMNVNMTKSRDFLSLAWVPSLFLGPLSLSANLAVAAAPDGKAAGCIAPLTLERIFDAPSLVGNVPTGIKFSPDGKRVTFLKAKTNNVDVRDLWEVDLTTFKQKMLIDADLFNSTLSEEEAASLERKRISNKGVVEYGWSNRSSLVIFPQGGDLYIQDVTKNDKAQRITQTKSAEIDSRFSPKDNFVSYVRDKNLYLLDLKTKKEWPVTTEGGGTLSYATAEFVAQEEMDRFTGYWWSPDEQYLALTEIDESPVPIEKRYEIGADGVMVHEQRYPRAGAANAKVRLGVVSVAAILSGQPRISWISTGFNGDIYLARAQWVQGPELVYQIQNRLQTELTMYRYQPPTLPEQAKSGPQRLSGDEGKAVKILQERERHWVNLNKDFIEIEGQGQFLWLSERTGYKHIYLVNRDGKIVRPLTAGDWVVDEVLGIDKKAGFVYFTSGYLQPLEAKIYRVSYLPSNTGLVSKPPPVELLTSNDPFHVATLAKSGDFFVTTRSSPLNPPVTSLFDNSGKFIADLLDNQITDKHQLFKYHRGLVEPEFGDFVGGSGQRLYYAILRPPEFNPQKKYPMIVYGYGGPIGQVVNKKFDARLGLVLQFFAQQGFVVMMVDNRGSPRRGKRFEDMIWKKFGQVEVEDQTAAVKHIQKRGFVDPERVGFFGWSYGGYLALMLAMKAGDVFKANVAVAPVTDFGLYDTHYTERYLGDRKHDAKIYKEANVLEYVSQLKSKLLVVHGMADDNVLFSNSTLLFKALQDKQKIYESLVYPGGKHGLYGKSSQTHVFKSIADFFTRHLMPRSQKESQSSSGVPLPPTFCVGQSPKQ